MKRQRYFIGVLGSLIATAAVVFAGHFDANSLPLVADGQPKHVSDLKDTDVAVLFFFDITSVGSSAFEEADKLRREYAYRGSDARCQTYVVGASDVAAEKAVRRVSKTMPALGFDEQKFAALNAKRLPWAVVVDKKARVRYSGPFDRDDVRREVNRYLDNPVLFCAVDKMWLALDDSTPSALHDGTTYYFCTDRSVNGLPMKAVFLEDPDRYIKESKDYLELIVAKVKSDEENPLPAVSKKDARPVMFQCPMKCEPPGPRPGVCPVCGMVKMPIKPGTERRDGK